MEKIIEKIKIVDVSEEERRKLEELNLEQQRHLRATFETEKNVISQLLPHCKPVIASEFSWFGVNLHLQLHILKVDFLHPLNKLHVVNQAIELARRKAEEDLRAKEAEMAMYEQVGGMPHLNRWLFLQRNR